jgi:hypothetical protein
LGTEKSLSCFYSVLPKSSSSFPVPHTFVRINFAEFSLADQGYSFFYPDIMKVTVDDGGEQGQKLVLQQS